MSYLRNELLRTPLGRSSRRMIYGRILGSVKLHSRVTALGQQGTEVQDGRPSTLGCTSPETPNLARFSLQLPLVVVRHRLYVRRCYVGGLYLPASWLTALRAEVGS